MSSGQAPASARVSHVADLCRPYPGDTVTFYTLVETAASLTAFTLRITVPPGLVLDDYEGLNDLGSSLPQITWEGGTNHLIWNEIREGTRAGCYEYRVATRVAPTNEARVLESTAFVSWEAEEDSPTQDQETATIAVSTKARSLKHLPAIYEEDALMGRFLMLFESFWTPIGQQIDNLPLYFDPRFTPPELVPWLASWLDLVLDERWPEHRRRRLLRSAASLFRRRGTRQGLEDYLEIYTGQRPKIIEHRAHNLRLGPEARLGPGIALGGINVPHTFSVIVRLPSLVTSEGEEARSRQELERRHKIEAIIEAEKPAHTGYDLRLDIDPSLALRETR